MTEPEAIEEVTREQRKKAVINALSDASLPVIRISEYSDGDVIFESRVNGVELLLASAMDNEVGIVYKGGKTQLWDVPVSLLPSALDTVKRIVEPPARKDGGEV